MSEQQEWWAGDMDGPVLGPFRNRTEAVRAYGVRPWRSMGEVSGVFYYRQAILPGASGRIRGWWVGTTPNMEANGFRLPPPRSRP